MQVTATASAEDFLCLQPHVHYDNALGFAQPRLWVWYRASAQPPGDFAPTSQDTFGPIFQVQVERPELEFKFKDGPGGLPVRWEPDSVNRRYEPLELIGTHGLNPGEIWVRASRVFVYPVELRQPESQSAAQFVSALQPKPGIYLPDTDGRHGLGATPLTDGRLLFGLYHPNAARVYVIGSFNNWQRPGADNEDPSQFIECQRYRGYFGDANTWLARSALCRAMNTTLLLSAASRGTDTEDRSSSFRIRTLGIRAALRLQQFGHLRRVHLRVERGELEWHAGYRRSHSV